MVKNAVVSRGSVREFYSAWKVVTLGRMPDVVVVIVVVVIVVVVVVVVVVAHRIIFYNVVRLSCLV